MKTAFIHPDLGIGGAERLVVDAAMGLQEQNQKITIYTSHCDKTHCFDEVASGKLNVKVYGDFLPIAIWGKLHILFAILRQLYLVLRIIASGEILEYDYFVVDQLSFAVPLLSVFSRPDCKVLFYCHFPDQLLVRKAGLVKLLYRKPFDALEQWLTGVADGIMVNSSFTKSIFYDTFPSLRQRDPAVVCPCVDTLAPTDTPADLAADKEVDEFFGNSSFLLSVNRFERLKNIELAVKAYAEFTAKSGLSPKLVIAGGFDPRVAENIEYLDELTQLCTEMGLTSFTFRGKLITMPKNTQVLFMPSVKNTLKNALLRKADLLLYTPTREHFGIVPVESMLNKTPVLAINHGGPLETVVNFENKQSVTNETGFNRPNNVSLWAAVLEQFYNLPASEKEKLVENGYNRAVSVFGREPMTNSFQECMRESRKTTLNKGIIYKMIELWKVWLVAAVAVVALWVIT